MCQRQIDVTSLEPFTKLKCPFCGQMVRVRRRFDQFMIVRQIGEGDQTFKFVIADIITALAAAQHAQCQIDLGGRGFCQHGSAFSPFGPCGVRA